jgi:hypothetical protein
VTAYVVAVTRDGYTTFYGPADKSSADGAAAEYGTLFTGKAVVWPLYPLEDR